MCVRLLSYNVQMPMRARRVSCTSRTQNGTTLLECLFALSMSVLLMIFVAFIGVRLYAAFHRSTSVVDEYIRLCTILDSYARDIAAADCRRSLWQVDISAEKSLCSFVRKAGRCRWLYAQHRLWRTEHGVRALVSPEIDYFFCELYEYGQIVYGVGIVIGSRRLRACRFIALPAGIYRCNC